MLQKTHFFLEHSLAVYDATGAEGCMVGLLGEIGVLSGLPQFWLLRTCSGNTLSLSLSISKWERCLGLSSSCNPHGHGTRASSVLELLTHLFNQCCSQLRIYAAHVLIGSLENAPTQQPSIQTSVFVVLGGRGEWRSRRNPF